MVLSFPVLQREILDHVSNHLWP